MGRANKIIVLIGLFLITLVVTNPSEVKYLNEIGKEYGAMHHGMSFSPAQLLEIGTGARSNFIFLSQYRYAFGNIHVEYIGFVGLIFKTGVSTSEENDSVSQDKEGIIA